MWMVVSPVCTEACVLLCSLLHTRVKDPTVHTATNDVLNGYREMSARAKPDIQAVIRRLTDRHEQHAAE